MRIIKEWNIKTWKCTLMHHNNRYTLKIEDGIAEQTYKMPDVDSESMATIDFILNAAPIQKRIAQIFELQGTLKNSILDELIDDQDEFDTII